MPVSEVYNIDCMQYMYPLADKVFDLAIVDPPYGIGEHGGKNRTGIQSRKKGIRPKNYENKGWDSIWSYSYYFTQLGRVSKNQIIWGANHFLDSLGSTSCMLVWDKKTNDGSDFADCEIAWTSFDTTIRKFKYDWVGFGYLNNPRRERKIHPTQKPVALYEWLLKNYAKPGDKILDTHLGSGSSRIAAYGLGFDFWATELDKDYYEAQEKRFKQAISQPLFENQDKIIPQTPMI